MTVRGGRVIGAAVVVAFAMTALVSAQARPAWVIPYRDGVKAYNDGKIDDAIRLLTNATAIDQVQNPRKPTGETLFPERYFPYLYLGLAQLKKGDLDNAQRNLDRAARDTSMMVKAELDRLAAGRADLAARRPAPPPPPPPDRGNQPPPPDRGNQPPAGERTGGPPPGPSQFELDAREAQNVLDRKQWADAARRYTELRQRNPTEFSRLNLGPKREQALKGQGEEIAATGKALLNDGKIPEARGKFEEAERVSPGTGAQGVRDADKREQDYRKAISDAQAAQGANNVAGAIQNFDRAKGLYPTQFATENHAATVDTLIRRRDSEAKDAAALADRKEAVRLVGVGKGLAASKRYADAEASYQQALAKDPNNTDAKDLLDRSRQFADASAEAKRFKQQNNLAAANGPARRAQDLDRARFQADSELVKLLAEIASQVTGADSLRVGLISCLQGKWKDAVAVLTPLAENPAGLDAAQRAHAHAYLAVSHATGALMTTSPDEGQQLSKQAIAEFRQALQLQPGYKLSETMVSPKIRQMLDVAR